MAASTRLGPLEILLSFQNTLSQKLLNVVRGYVSIRAVVLKNTLCIMIKMVAENLGRFMYSWACTFFVPCEQKC